MRSSFGGSSRNRHTARASRRSGARVAWACRAREDPSIQALVAADTPVVTIVGKSSATHVRARARDHARRESAPHRRHGRVLPRTREGRDLRRRALLRWAGADESYALEDARGGARCGCVGARALRHERRQRAAHDRSTRWTASLGACARRSASTRTTIAVSRSRTRSPPSTRAAMHAQGTVNGYGERCGNLDLLALVANLQLKRGIQCVSDESLATPDGAVALRRVDRQSRARCARAVRRSRGVRAQGRHPRRRSGEGSRQCTSTWIPPASATTCAWS